MSSWAYNIYRGLTSLASPLIGALLRRRLQAGKEDPLRLSERLGIPSRERPAGSLIWVHAASVGESLSLLSLIGKIMEEYPSASVLVTTGTVTSARLMAQRLPPRAFHQFIPADVPGWAFRFMDHWRPDFILWAESELWPNFLFEIGQREIPAVLVNARMSEKSFARWKKISSFSRSLLEKFTLCLAQNKAEAWRYQDLGARRVEAPGNLKYAATPLPFDESALKNFQEVVKSRPVWLFSSTHPGEEEIAATIHRRLKAQMPGLLTVIVPRHPKRGDDIAKVLHGSGLAVCRRAENGAWPAASDDIYIADTLGELGLFYRAISLCVMGGSFVPHGGHNPIEPGQLGCKIFYGPHMHNFETICHDFETAQAAQMLAGAEALEKTLRAHFTDPALGNDMAQNAKKLTQGAGSVVDDIFTAIKPLLEGVL